MVSTFYKSILNLMEYVLTKFNDISSLLKVLCFLPPPIYIFPLSCIPVVYFLKRTQIFAADLWRHRFGGCGYGEFYDIDSLAMFAD